MKLVCSHCGAPIAAADINVQALIAVCSACDEVFSFGTPSTMPRKAKPRKLNPPEGIQAWVQTDRLFLAYNALDNQGSLLTGLEIAACLIVIVGNLALWVLSNLPLGIMLGLTVLTLVFVYVIAAVITSATEIKADPMGISVTQGPLPFPGREERRITAEGVIDILYRKTDEDMPHWLPVYQVVAEMQKGKSVTIVASLQRDMARFIAHTLDDFIRTVEVEADVYVLDAAPDVVIETEDGELDPAALDTEARHANSARQ